MKNSTQNNQQKQKKENQFVFIEYEKARKDGHFMTIMDSYRNVIGRVNKSFNDETKKYEYASFDHAGKPFSKSEKLWELKNEFINNREQLLEQAHQRRIASNEKSKEVPEEKSQKGQQTERAEERKNEMEKLRKGNTGKEKSNEKADEKADDISRKEYINPFDEERNQMEERAEELNDLRNDKDDERGDMDLER